jgi:hypothetical protein
MEGNFTVVILAFILVALLVAGGGGSLVEGLSHKSTAVRPHGTKLTRAAIAQMASAGPENNSERLYRKRPPCEPRLLRHGGRVASKLCDCGEDGTRPASEFPGNMCSPYDHVFG